VETLHAPHGTELEPVKIVGRPAISNMGQLSIWIEQERPKWLVRGVDMLEDNGQTLFAWLGVDGKWKDEVHVHIGTVESCVRLRRVESEFVHLIVLGGGMSVEHAQLLIENAVDQVAGR
jgi:hypothetical protein